MWSDLREIWCADTSFPPNIENMPKSKPEVNATGGGHIGFRFFGHIFAEELDNESKFGAYSCRNTLIRSEGVKNYFR